MANAFQEMQSDPTYGSISNETLEKERATFMLDVYAQSF